MPAARIFHFVMIKPTHYDDAGYPIQWMRSDIPSNSLAVIYGLALDASRRRILGEDVDFRLTAYDETNTRTRPRAIAKSIRQDGGVALIGLVGVQSNQYPRALDLARQFLAEGIPVALGGFHVSGSLAMLERVPKEILDAQALGVSLFTGEAEHGALDELLRDAYAGQLKPLYDHMDALPHLEGQPIPILPTETVERTRGRYTSFDLGRGCPFKCSFCTIINVQGRKSRFRTPDDLEAIIRENARQGIHNFFITDDNFARNANWEGLFDRLIHLRESEGVKLKLIIQVDTLCHRIPRFVEKACRAGVTRVFLGLENINPDNLLAAKKNQNRITEYRTMLQEWRKYGATTYAGYILGFPNDTKESILKDVEIIKRELPIDLLEFFFLTPLPGSEDHKRMVDDGRWTDPDLNKYDLHHRVTHHPRMTDNEWEDAYRAAWRTFYCDEHLETVIRRAAAASNGKPHAKAKAMLWFSLMFEIEKVHPLEGGIFRRKYRRDRRPGLALESPPVFYAKYAGEILLKLYRYGWMISKAYRTYKRVERDSGTTLYRDLAITPADTHDLETFEMYTETSGGQAAVAKSRRLSRPLGLVDS